MRYLRLLAKQIVHAVPWLREMERRGWFSPPVARQRVVNFIFQRLFRMNADSPWSVHFTSQIVCPEKLQVGDGVEKSLMFSNGYYIQAGNGVTIGEGTILGPGVKIISANHDPLALEHWLPGRPIRIGKRCWLGAGVIILPEVELGDNTVVGAGSIVTRSFPSHVIIAGAPVRVIAQNDTSVRRDERRDSGGMKAAAPNIEEA